MERIPGIFRLFPRLATEMGAMDHDSPRTPVHKVKDQKSQVDVEIPEVVVPGRSGYLP